MGKGIFTTISEKLTCLQVLNFMVLTGFMFNYMLRVNLTIAIVAMVEPTNKTMTIDNDTNTAHYHEYECYKPPAVSIIPEDNATSDATMKPPVAELEQTRFNWDEPTQNLILGCFFWGYVLTELPGGRMAEVFGARRIFGYSMLIASIMTLATPLAANISHYAVVALRVVIGFTLGATWPAIQPMASKWIPPMDRSKFIANMMASSLGAALTMPMCGYLIAHLGWESVFYVTGTISIVWSILWFLLVFDSPAEHPRIADEERRFIENAIGTGTAKGKPPSVPWGKMLTSLPVWAIIITHAASVFGYFTVVNQLPTYMKNILGFNIKENGLLSSLPYFGKYFFAITTSYIADYLRKSGTLSTTAARKLFTGFAVGVPGLFMMSLVFFGCDRFWSVFFFTAALTINGAVTAGYLGNGLDIAPNFSGTIFGLANTLSSSGGYISTFMVGVFTNNNQTFNQWSKVFGVLAGTYTTGALMFLIFGSGDMQEWNNPKKETKEDPEAQQEMLPVRTKH
ncbi:sialin [Cloeon dipterum]|uniref:sialin n=1 Tax=Cloeon dipterum TaxID=197152 RepID=UPI00321FA3CB